MNLATKLRLTLSTIRYLTLEQIACRVRTKLRNRLRDLFKKQFVVPEFDPIASFHTFFQGLDDIPIQASKHPDVNHAIEHATAIENGFFSFLGLEKKYSGDIDWNDQSVSRLWLFNLHYFDWVNDLLIASEALGQHERFFMIFRNQVTSWLRTNKRLTGDGWHPYTLSSRIVNWLLAYEGFEQQIASDQAFSLLLKRSIYQKTRILFSDLEFDVQGNHLLRNLKAIIWSGITFEGKEADSWLHRGLEILKDQLSFQVLKDGGHYERSPYYHCVVLKDLLEIAVLLRRSQKLILPWLNLNLRKMTEYLVAILPDNGRIPLLKDSVLEETPNPTDLIAAVSLCLEDPTLTYGLSSGVYPALLFGANASQALSQKSDRKRELPDIQELKDSGYLVMRDHQAQHHLIYDFGPPCPDSLPAHAHADMFSYELTLNGKPVVVDSGVYEYSEGRWRDYFRSTRAHNTVEVNGENQSEVWSSFRVGRRAKPFNVNLSQSEDIVTITGEHDGYTRLRSNVRHQRTLFWRKNRFWLIVDELLGGLPFTASNFVHFHSAFDVCSDGSPYAVTSENAHVAWLTPFGADQSHIVHAQEEPFIQGWYSERFGSMEPNHVLELSAQNTPHCLFGYALSTDTSITVHEIVWEKGVHYIHLEHSSQLFSFVLPSCVMEES